MKILNLDLLFSNPYRFVRFSTILTIIRAENSTKINITTFFFFLINDNILFWVFAESIIIYDSTGATSITNIFDTICTPEHTPRDHFEKKNISNTYTSPYIITSLHQPYHYYTHLPFIRIIGIIRFPETYTKLNTALLHLNPIELFDNLLYILFPHIFRSDVSKA